MKVALYVRVSRKEQTLEQQTSQLMSYCQNEGFKVFQVYADHGVSGASESRPQLDLMLQDMRKRQFEAILVLKYDRLGRSTIHLLQVLEELKEKNIRLIAITQNIDTSTPMGKWFMTNLISLAEMEREMIIERTQDKLDYYKEKIKKDGFYINKNGEKKTSLGRPVGSKDKAYRRKSGYYMRYANKAPLAKSTNINEGGIENK